MAGPPPTGGVETTRIYSLNPVAVPLLHLVQHVISSGDTAQADGGPSQGRCPAASATGAMARSLGPQRHRGIETACPPRRYARREHRDPGHEDGHGAEDRGIQRSNVEQHRGHQSNERKGREQAEARSCDHERRPRARDTRPRRASHPSCCRGRATRRPEGLGRWRAAPSARPSALSPCRPPRWTSTRGATRPDRAAHGRARRSRSQTAACSRPRRARRWRLSSRRRAARA